MGAQPRINLFQANLIEVMEQHFDREEMERAIDMAAVPKATMGKRMTYAQAERFIGCLLQIEKERSGYEKSGLVVVGLDGAEKEV